MKFSADDVQKIASLAHLRLRADEVSSYTQHFNQILKHLEILQQATAAVDAAPGKESPLPLRQDVVVPSLSQETALSQAPEKFSAYFLVPKVVE